MQAISCTPTLELGIDVGNVDCVISSTIPVNRLTQRIGRAARKGQRGYAFLVLGMILFLNITKIILMIILKMLKKHTLIQIIHL